MKKEIKTTLDKMAKYIEENGCVKLEMILHLHFDKDDEFDYTGGHTIHMNVHKKEREIKSYLIDLEGLSVDNCRAIQSNVLVYVKSFYPNATTREITHK
jgi:hypothetical protein